MFNLWGLMRGGFFDVCLRVESGFEWVVGFVIEFRVAVLNFSGARHSYSTSSANELQKMVKTSSVLGWNTIDKWKSRKDLLPPTSILKKEGE